MQDKDFNSFASNKIKPSVNETKWSVVSVLIGHVFGFSAENVNISSQFAWIASLLGVLASFPSVDSFCEFYFPVAVFLSIYFVFLVTHTCWARWPRAPLAASLPTKELYD